MTRPCGLFLILPPVRHSRAYGPWTARLWASDPPTHLPERLPLSKRRWCSWIVSKWRKSIRISRIRSIFEMRWRIAGTVCYNLATRLEIHCLYSVCGFLLINWSNSKLALFSASALVYASDLRAAIGFQPTTTTLATLCSTCRSDGRRRNRRWRASSELVYWTHSRPRNFQRRQGDIYCPARAPGTDGLVSGFFGQRRR